MCMTCSPDERQTTMDITYPLDAATVAKATGPFGGALQGDDRRNHWDVEFPNMERAASFATYALQLGWLADLREPARTIYRSVVLTIRPVSA